MGGSAEEVSGAVGLAASAAAGLAASAAVDLVVSADSVGASDVSVVVDSDVVSDSTVGMVGVITPTTTDAIIRVWTHDMAEELEHWQMDASALPRCTSLKFGGSPGQSHKSSREETSV